MLSHSLVRVAIFAALLLAGAAVLYFFGPHRRDEAANGPASESAAPDPRLTFATPYRNVRPDVAYVGDVACAPCHKDLCDSFHRHPMGRSAAFWNESERIEQFGPSAHTTFAAPKGARYRVEEKDGRLWQTEELLGADGQTLAGVPADAAIAIGSGQQAISYLCIRDGSLWETAVSWYTARQRWDRSPGLVPGNHGQRPITELCLYCHVNHVERVPGSEMRYREPIFGKQAHIGCERCHGPGALHVRERTDGQPLAGLDKSIVNPRDLAADLRDAVCQQCHLQGVRHVTRRDRSVFDFRPGLPLEMFQSVFVRAQPAQDSVQFLGHVEQMAASRCAIASAGKLACTSCHNPHFEPPPAQREQYYRQSCLKCHADRGCSLPAAERRPANDSCTACHMPRRATANISHVAVTDHRILRRPGGKVAARPRPNESGLPIEYFYAGSRFAPPPEELERDRGIALAFLVRVNRAQGRYDPALTDAAATRLNAATSRFPRDAAAWEWFSVVAAADGNTVEALADVDHALAIPPAREASLHEGARLAMQLKEFARMREFARQAVELNPGNSVSRLLYGLSLIEMGAWADAERELRMGLRDLPRNSDARVGLAACLYHLGDAPGARNELERAIAFAPRQASSLREWYRLHTQK